MKALTTVVLVVAFVVFTPWPVYHDWWAEWRSRKALRRGGRIRFCDGAIDGWLRCGVLLAITDTHVLFRAYSDDTILRATTDLEGITWVRGWDNLEAQRALLTTRALRNVA